MACIPASASPADETVRSPVLAATLEKFRQACPDESVDAAATPVKVVPGMVAIFVKLTSSKGQ